MTNTDRLKRHSEGERVTWIGAIANLVLALVKFVAGIVGRSEALIADAAHSLSDLLSDFVVLVSLKIAKRPIDEERPYGYGRVETVGTGILGIILIGAGIGIFWDAISTIRGGVEHAPTYTAFIAAVTSIVGKELMYQYTVRVGRRIHSPSVIANAWHHRSDAFSSIATSIGIAAAMFGWPIFDPLAAIIVTGLIIKAGWDISSESFMDIIDTSVKKEVRNRIIRAALEPEGATSYHDLKTRKTGSEILVDIHIEVDPLMDVTRAHVIADEVKDNIMQKVINIADVLVHIDPEGEYDRTTSPDPKTDIINDIAKAATETEGISSCSDIRVHNAGDDLIAGIKISLEPDLKIRDGHEKVAALRQRLMKIERLRDVIIHIDLK
ncbi:MAG: cation-efflux pump [bacterium]|nr:cation-efflux pump [bacterium]